MNGLVKALCDMCLTRIPVALLPKHPIAVEYMTASPPHESRNCTPWIEFPTDWRDIYAETKLHGEQGIEVRTRFMGDEREWAEIPSFVVTQADFESMK